MTTVSWFETATPAMPRSPASRVPLRFASAKTTPETSTACECPTPGTVVSTSIDATIRQRGGIMLQVCVGGVDHRTRVLRRLLCDISRLAKCSSPLNRKGSVSALRRSDQSRTDDDFR